MECSNKNIVINGKFDDGLKSWTGKNMKLTTNPLSPDNSCVLMGNKKTIYNPKVSSILKQTIKGPFERGCAYYLRYRLMHAVALEPTDLFFATVAYLDYRRRIINSTPVYIIPNHRTLRWFDYYSIVPPAPWNTALISVSFLFRSGMMYIDDIQLASQTIKTNEDGFTEEVEEDQKMDIFTPQAGDPKIDVFIPEDNAY